MRGLHPASGYGVVPDDLKEGQWQVRLWDGQTGESEYVVSQISSLKHAEEIRNTLHRDARDT
jgi:hypothetical protein